MSQSLYETANTILEQGFTRHCQQRRDSILRFGSLTTAQQSIVQEHFSHLIPPPQEGELRTVCLKEAFRLVPLTFLATAGLWLLPIQRKFVYIALANGVPFGLSLVDSIYTFNKGQRAPVLGKGLDLYGRSANILAALGIVLASGCQPNRSIRLLALASGVTLIAIPWNHTPRSDHLERETISSLEWVQECLELKNRWEQEGTPTTDDAQTQRKQEVLQWAQRCRERDRNETPADVCEALDGIMQPLVQECVALPTRTRDRLLASIETANQEFDAIDEQAMDDPVAVCEAYANAIPILPSLLDNVNDLIPCDIRDPAHQTAHGRIHPIIHSARAAHVQIFQRYQRKLRWCDEQNLDEGQTQRLQTLRSTRTYRSFKERAG